MLKPLALCGALAVAACAPVLPENPDATPCQRAAVKIEARAGQLAVADAAVAAYLAEKPGATVPTALAIARAVAAADLARARAEVAAACKPN